MRHLAPAPGSDVLGCCGRSTSDLEAGMEPGTTHRMTHDRDAVDCPGQVRAHHAPENTPDDSRGWSSAAAASIAAAEAAATGADLTAARRGADATTATGPTVSGYLEPAGDRWAQMERSIGARERRTVLSSQVVEDCAARVAAWANSLPTPEQRQTGLDAADVVRKGR